MSEIPVHLRPRRLTDWINPTDARKVHSLVDKGYQRKNLETAWEKWKPTGVVALTASAMKGDRERCIEAGMSDYLTKPIRLDDLTSALQKAADA